MYSQAAGGLDYRPFIAKTLVDINLFSLASFPSNFFATF